jgi:hypothetical protein
MAANLGHPVLRNNTDRSPRCNAHQLATRGFGTWSATELGKTSGRWTQEEFMTSKSVQWTVWAVLMVVFTALTLTARWLDLAFALTVAAVVWYGIVPAPRSGRQ